MYGVQQYGGINTSSIVAVDARYTGIPGYQVSDIGCTWGIYGRKLFYADIFPNTNTKTLVYYHPPTGVTDP